MALLKIFKGGGREVVDNFLKTYVRGLSVPKTRVRRKTVWGWEFNPFLSHI